MIGGLAMLAGAAGAVLATGATETPVGTANRAAIEKIVREYILSHPEILPEAMRNLEAREARTVIAARAADLTAWMAGVRIMPRFPTPLQLELSA